MTGIAKLLRHRLRWAPNWLLWAVILVLPGLTSAGYVAAWIVRDPRLYAVAGAATLVALTSMAEGLRRAVRPVQVARWRMVRSAARLQRETRLLPVRYLQVFGDELRGAASEGATTK